MLAIFSADLGARAPVLTPTPNLVADGIPRIPASIAADVRRYTEYLAANLVDWHPPRRELLMAARFANAPQLHLVKSPGGARRQSTFADEPITQRAISARPLFVVQGGNDPRVPRTESEQMVARVKKHGTPVWYLMANDEGHGFAKKSNVDFQFYATVMFMKEFLLGP